MVIKPQKTLTIENGMFESSVISYGDKTLACMQRKPMQFESSVISYGDKTR